MSVVPFGSKRRKDVLFENEQHSTRTSAMPLLALTREQDMNRCMRLLYEGYYELEQHSIQNLR